MRGSKVTTLALSILLASANVLPLAVSANAPSKIQSAAQGVTEQPKKSQIGGLTTKANTVISKTIPKKKASLLETKFNSKMTKENQNTAPYLTDELIVTYKKETKESTKNNFKQKYSLKQTKVLNSVNSEVVKIPKGKKVTDYAASIKKDPAVASVQPNYKYYAAETNSTPNYYSQLWGANNTGQSINGLPGVKNIDVDAPEALAKYSGVLKTVLVGVIDTGVDINHPDLKNKIWTNPKEIPNDGIDNDHNGYVDDVHGWDFYNKDNSVYDPLDGDEHGTHVSGIIAGQLEGGSASTNTGIAGVAPNVKIVPIKFLGPEGGTSADAISAIEYAQKLGIKVLNNSWGGGDYDPLLEKAIKNYNGLFIVAAGNDGVNIDSTKSYPASFDSSNILSVAALDNQGNLADFSNYGANTVDVAAPGVDILSSVPKFPADEISGLLGMKQLGAAAQVTNSKLGYKAIFDGVGYEKYTGTDGTDALTKALTYLDIPKDTTKKILLVQDDEHDLGSLIDDPTIQYYFKDYLSVYKKLLTGYNYTPITISSDSSIKESGVDLASYDAVIWFTGHGLGLNTNDLTALTKDDVSALTTYLNGGGRLLLTGQDALGGNEASPFVTDLLHLSVFSDLGPILNVEGLTGSIYAGKKYAINKFEAPYPFADFIDSNSPEATVSLKYVSDYRQAYSYESGTSMAAPHVTGTAAILMGLSPTLSPELLKLYISEKGKSLPQLDGLLKNGKIIKESQLNTFSDNSFPGTPLTKNIITNTVNNSTDKNDVFALSLKAGESISLSLVGKSGTDFDLYVYDQSAKDINTARGIVASSETLNSSKEAIQYTAPKAGVYYVDVYAYKGTGSYKLKVGNFGGTYEDDSKFISYNGAWKNIVNAQLSGGKANSLNSDGEADFSFIGYSFEWQGFKDQTQGVADIYIDGNKLASPSLYSADYKAKQTIFKKIYSTYGQHYVKIVWTGTSDPAAKKSAAGINIDRFIVKSIPNAVNVRYDATIKQPVVSWTASSWAASYNIYRKVATASDADYKKLNSAPVTGLSFTDTTAVFGKTYVYAVSLNTKDNQETGLSVPFTYIFDDDSKGSISITSSKVSGHLNTTSLDINDVWSKQLEKGKTYKLVLTGPTAANFDLNLFTIGTSTIYGTSPIAKSTNKNSNETIVFKPTKTGVYYIVPTAKSGSGNYSLTVTTQK
ncbi:S8 family serine peptidase [Neobacillus cucumis]|uniref:S8 family serine peptidase n=1 Tax=Neobacillus cucumis TaxID=1740721 RepID=UPI0028533D6A|nr:S8 family serine peptidase [Neobacillus cucumis]MDR4948818.1 S8 family serine peptidase [Neobacillus cucumis]